jgi:hypothetical protein
MGTAKARSTVMDARIAGRIGIAYAVVPKIYSHPSEKVGGVGTASRLALKLVKERMLKAFVTPIYSGYARFRIETATKNRITAPPTLADRFLTRTDIKWEAVDPFSCNMRIISSAIFQV